MANTECEGGEIERGRERKRVARWLVSGRREKEEERERDGLRGSERGSAESC